MNRDKMQRQRILQRRTRLPQIASSGYSGSDGRCGDSCRWMQLPDGRVAVAISDGMGKGEMAARESERAVNSVLPLLAAGMDPEMALQVLNLLWSMSNRKERFPTMDLALLNPDIRELVIYKIGAAPTVIVRAPRCRPGRNQTPGTGPRVIDSKTPERVEILAAPALPMGVTESGELPCVSTLVMPGDRIIMMTDGISDSKRDDPDFGWLRRLLSRIRSRNLQTICDLIIREAALNYGPREKDDMTVVAVRV